MQFQTNPLHRLLALLVVALVCVPDVSAQSVIPREYRGEEGAISRGVLAGNLIETNYRNHGELARFGDIPHGVWPRGIGGRHIDGIGIVVGGTVPGERVKWGLAARDTVLNPVIINYRDAGRRAPFGRLWGWLPLPGFNNPLRLDPITGLRSPTPAQSSDPTSWPAFWPDRLTNPDDPGWRNDDVDGNSNRAAWNGIFGKGVLSADEEAFYVMDDHSDYEYALNPNTRQPYSSDGVFYASRSDSTMGGMGLQVGVRLLQWANVLAEDIMFILYDVSNVGETFLPDLYFSQIADFGLGQEEGDESAAFNPQLDVVYGWDQDGIGTRPGGGTYRLGYVGFAFLESPGRPNDGIDNDEDGITDESRFSGPGRRIVGRDNIRATVLASYNAENFTRFNDPTNGLLTFEQVLESRPAFQAGVWWTGDENLDWVGFEDTNGNGVWDEGEPLNDDLGLDGLGPNDVGYPGPDTGEGDGIPTVGEPNFDRTDVDESDQIGLTGFELNTRPFFESGENLRSDSWMWERIQESLFPPGTRPDQFVADVEPFILFTSGPIELAPQSTTPERSTDFFSTSWVFGDDLQDFLKNRRTAQSIYNADYQFAQPPLMPTLQAVAGDGRVILTWDSLALRSFDRFTQEFDFEGFKLYRGTDPLLSDARTITDARGTPTFFRPLAQWDLRNGVRGLVDALDGTIKFDLGEDTGLQFYYEDTNVRNGFTYYYALVAYDRGSRGADVLRPAIDPQENVFNIAVDLAGNLRGQSRNTAVVMPRPRAAGYVSAGVNEDLRKPTSGIGTGSMGVRVFDDARVDLNALYRVRFKAEPLPGTEFWRTSSFTVDDVRTGRVFVEDAPFTGDSPALEGYFLAFQNEPLFRLDIPTSGYLARDTTVLNPRLSGINSSWVATIQEANRTISPEATLAPWDYELIWVNPSDSLYTPPRYQLGRFLREPIPIFARNVQRNTPVDIFIEDLNENEVFDFGDRLVLSEGTGSNRLFRYYVTFRSDNGTNQAPPANTRLRISTRRPFATGDEFRFTLTPPGVDTDLAREELRRITVVPNPYVAAAAWEPASPQIVGRGERRIQFRNLPQECTIRIYNLRGELVRTLEYRGGVGEGAMFWDLRTSQNQDVAAGVYIYHVDAPGIGEHIGKFALVK